MAGAQAQTVSPSSLLLRGSQAGNVNVLPNGGGAGPSSGQLPSLSLVAGRRAQFGGVNMLAGFSNNPFLNGGSNPGLSGVVLVVRSALAWLLFA